jgi:kumamolisin
VSRSRWVVPIAVLLLAAFVVPGLLAGNAVASTTSQQVPTSTSGAQASLPAALAAPWADRVGYVSGLPADSGSTSAASGQVSVFVTLWPRNLSLFSPRSDALAPLTSAQFDEQYSPSTTEYQSVIDYFEGYGLSILHTWPDRLSVTVTGSAASVGAAFGTTLLRGTVGGLPVQYPQTVPVLPSTLESDISAVSGLSSGFSQFTLPLEPVSPSLLSTSHVSSALQTTTSELTPSGAHGAYGFDGLYNLSGTFHSASSQGIVLLLWGDGYSPSDISTFFSTYYPSEYPVQPTVNYYPIDGAPDPSANAVNDPSGGPQELTLDLEWSGSMAPGATLDAVYAPDGPAPSYSPNDTPMEDALAYAVNSISGVSVISMSFGLPESEDTSFQAAYTTYFAEAESKGITLLGASGDDGGSVLKNGACTATPEVEFPASSPDVIGVGGTAPVMNVSLSGQVTGISTQPAWNRSGGGLSQDYGAPSWQLVGSAANVIGSGGRGVPDVAGPAADNMLYYDGGVKQLAGTSFATPMWAGLIAELNAVRGSPLGFVTPRLYALASQEEESGGPVQAFSDVTAGSNCLNSAQSGWDLVTGWGTPRVLVLYAALTSTFVSLSLSPSPNSVFPGDSTTVTVEVRNATTNAPISGLTVQLAAGASSGYAGPCGGSFGNASVVTNATGAAAAKFTVPYCYFGGQAAVSATLLSGGFFGEASAIVRVSLLNGGFLSLVSTFPYNVAFFLFILIIAVIIGLVLSRRKRQRQMPPQFPSLSAGAPPGASQSWAPTAPPAPPTPTRPPGASPSNTPSSYWTPASSASVSPATPASRPAAQVYAPPPSVTASSPTGPSVTSSKPAAMPQAVRCPSCGALIPAFSLTCPKCGLARP